MKEYIKPSIEVVECILEGAFLTASVTPVDLETYEYEEDVDQI